MERGNVEWEISWVWFPAPEKTDDWQMWVRGRSQGVQCTMCEHTLCNVEGFWPLSVSVKTFILPVRKMQFLDWTGKWQHWYQFVTSTNSAGLQCNNMKKKNIREDVLSLGIVTINYDWWTLPKHGHLRSFCQLLQVTVSLTLNWEGEKGKT